MISCRQTPNRLCQSIRMNGLEQIIEGFDLHRLKRIFVIGGYKDELNELGIVPPPDSNPLKTRSGNWRSDEYFTYAISESRQQIFAVQFVIFD